MRIYLVEDDVAIRNMELYALENKGYEVSAFSCADELYMACSETLPDLMILDIMLPGEDGLSILSTLRRSPKTSHIPVMMVTAKGSEWDRVKGLDDGADDYLVKPFSVLEFLSRVKALLRRTMPIEKSACYAAGPITIDDAAHTAFVNEQPCILTRKEYELLKLLISHKEHVLTREHILTAVWGYDMAGGTRTVDMHIKTLRQKLQDAAEHIQTIRGVGYKYAEEL